MAPPIKIAEEEAVRLYLEHGSIRAAAKAAGITRVTFQTAIDRAEKRGLTKPRVIANPSRWRPADEIVAQRKAEFDRVKASSPTNTGNTVHLSDDGPFMVIVLGDEHLDNSGTDLQLFERWIAPLDRQKRVTGISMGDMLDNWTKPLAHLYGQAETTAHESWVLLKHYMEIMGPNLDASVGGNHDKWSGAGDLLANEMEEYGVLHQDDLLRFAWRTPQGRDITVTARHKWAGHSQWNDVHAIKKAARMGQRDHILLGGHTHVSGETTEKCPMTGKITHCYQVASFKIYDDYAVTCGFTDRNMSPALALVIDPRRADTDPELCKHFYEPEAALEYLGMLRRSYAKRIKQ